LKKSEMELLAVDQKIHRVISSETAPKAEMLLSVDDVEAAATRTTIYFAEDAREIWQGWHQPRVPTYEDVAGFSLTVAW
jgi:hypothetical protein